MSVEGRTIFDGSIRRNGALGFGDFFSFLVSVDEQKEIKFKLSHSIRN
jgi:hypothetical protein